MSHPHVPAGYRGSSAIAGAVALIAVLLVVQMWLLTATLDAFLGGHREVPLPAAIISGVMFLACLGLYLFIQHLDARLRRS
jgi:predicted Co/Zn/Cd cation transporter (cation efflux family)